MDLCATFWNAARRRRVMARAIACGVLLVLPSCRIPCLQPPPPPPAIPADFNGRTDPQTSAQLGVDEFFQDPLLTGLIGQALAGNQELKILEQDIQIARNEVLGRRGAYLPFVSLRGDAGLEKPSFYTPLGAAEDQLLTPTGRPFPDPLPNFQVAADVNWQIDIWRALRNARDAAAQRFVAAIERRNFFVTQLVAEIATNYFQLMSLDQRLQILDRIITLQEQSLKVAIANMEAGRDTNLPVQRFQADVQKNQSEKLIVTQEIIETENRVNFLLGRYPQPVERFSANFLDLNLTALNVGVPAQLLLYRTDIRQAERELAAAGLDVKVARARFFPRLDLTASVGFEAFHPRYLFNPEAFVGNIAGELVQPLINKKAIQADYLSANARQIQAVFNYQRVVLNAFTEVVNNLAGARNYYQSVEIKKQQLATLEIAVDVATKLFQSARASYGDVLFSQRDLLDARTLVVQTKLQQLTALVDAYQALGGGVLLATSTLDADGLYCPPPAALQPGDAPTLPPPPPAVPPAIPPEVPPAVPPPLPALPIETAAYEGSPSLGDAIGWSVP